MFQETMLPEYEHSTTDCTNHFFLLNGSLDDPLHIRTTRVLGSEDVNLAWHENDGIDCVDKLHGDVVQSELGSIESGKCLLPLGVVKPIEQLFLRTGRGHGCVVSL